MSADRFRASPLVLWAALAAFIALPGRAVGQVSFPDSAEQLIMAGQRAADERSQEGRERGIQLFQLALAQLGEAHQEGRASAVLNYIGATYRELGSTDSALVYYRRALEARRRQADREGEGNTLHNIGLVLNDRGRSDSALVYFHRSLAIKREVKNRYGEAELLAAVGLAHQTLSRADSAAEYLSQSLAIARALGDRRLQAQPLEFFGSVHRDLGRIDSARFYYNEAQGAYREVGDSAGVAATRTSLAYLLSAAPPDSLLAELYGTLVALRALQDFFREANLLDRIGTVHFDAGRPDSALAYYAQARTIQRRIGQQRSEGATLTHIALVHADQGRADSALAYYGWALPLLREVGDRREVGSALGNMGILYHNAGTPGAMRRAVAYYDSAAAVLAEVGRSAGDDGSWVSYSELNVPLFEAWVMAWLGREKQVGRRRAAHAALAAVERGRAQALRDLMRRSGAAGQDAGGAPGQAGAGADMPAEGVALASALGRGGVTALSYVVTDSTLVVFLVRPGRDVEAFTTVISHEAVAALVEDVRKGLGADDAGLPGAPGGNGSGAPAPDAARKWRVAAAHLADLLLPPGVREALPDSGELVIVPSRSLFLLPFALLPLSWIVEGDSLLGLRYAIRYAPSLQVLTTLEAQPRQSHLLEQPLVVGNPAMPWIPDTTGFKPSQLDSAGVEARWVADRVGSRALVAGAATETTVRERLGTATLVHLATHGMAYATPDSARNSYVVLAEGRDNDGRLTVGELLDAVPAMRAELVVLSACQTGLGDLTRAEGTVGLQRAFLGRGARGVLVSLWSVSDAPTPTLMRSFYEHWMGGTMTRAQALRQAQMELARSKEFSHPRYWAAFQLVGAR